MTFMQASWRGVRLTVIAATLVLAGPALAQQPSASSLKMAGEISKLTGADEVFAPLIPGVIEQARLFFVQQDPTLTNDATAVANELRKELEPRLQEVYSKVTQIYASHFTEPELKEILAFYTSPAGKKLLAEQPKVVDESLKFAQEWSASLSDEVIGKMREGLKKKGHKL